MDYDQIRDYCEEALETAEHIGVYEGLSFLIGDKFYHLYRGLKKIQNKLKYIDGLSDRAPRETPQLQEREFEIFRNPKVHHTFRRYLAKVRKWEATRDQFVNEIKDYFDPNDIEEYLNSYPRMGIKQQTGYSDWEENEEGTLDSPEDVLAEVNDILTVEEMKKLFL